MSGTAAAKQIKLPSGGFIPTIGFGTWMLKTDVEDTICKAVRAGYRHIDTAHMYKNEHEIGNALSMLFQEGVVKREDLFIVTKLPSHAHYREKVTEMLKGSLEKLKLSYVDLYLIHSPMSTLKDNGGKPVFPTDIKADHVDTWKGMEDAYNQGLTKAIGLSNFNSKQITRILKNCTIKPVNLQVECHAYLQQRKLYQFCQENNITFTAYSPLGRPGLINKNGKTEPVLMQDEQVKAVAEKHKKTSVQVLLRFLIQLGMSVIPKSANEGRMKENFQLFDFTLDDEDLATMKSLDRGLRYVLFDSVPGQTDHPQYPFTEDF